MSAKSRLSVSGTPIQNSRASGATVWCAQRIRRAASVLARGGVVAYPTEAVWGLGADPYSPYAVERLLRLKNRDVRMGVILIADSMEQLEPFLNHLPAEQRARLAQSWPGPVTWLVPVNHRVPPWISGAHRSIALRVTAHPAAAALCAAFGAPLVSSSANPHGAQPARHLFQVRRYFGTLLDDIVPGNTGGLARPTEIRRVSDMTVVRQG